MINETHKVKYRTWKTESQWFMAVYTHDIPIFDRIVLAYRLIFDKDLSGIVSKVGADNSFARTDEEGE